MGYSPWGREELVMTERLRTQTQRLYLLLSQVVGAILAAENSVPGLRWVWGFWSFFSYSVLELLSLPGASFHSHMHSSVWSQAGRNPSADVSLIFPCASSSVAVFCLTNLCSLVFLLFVFTTQQEGELNTQNSDFCLLTLWLWNCFQLESQALVGLTCLISLVFGVISCSVFLCFIAV